MKHTGLKRPLHQQHQLLSLQEPLRQLMHRLGLASETAKCCSYATR